MLQLGKFKKFFIMVTVYQVHANGVQEPHLAKDCETHRQWLGEGFYFWEHALCARIWERQLNQFYSVTNTKVYSAEVQLRQDKVLDLLSNTEHMMKFYQMAQHIRQKLDEKGKKNFSLNYILNRLHEENIFENSEIIGVKIGTPWNRDKVPVAYKPHDNNSKVKDSEKPESENFFFIQKIQICIFSFAKNEINDFKEYFFKEDEIKQFRRIGI